MRRALFALLAVTFLASSTGCCCLDKLFCWGCRGRCNYGCDGGCDSCGGGGGGCSDCGAASNMGPGMGGYARGPGRAQYNTMAARRAAPGHPFVRERRDADGDYEFAAGPPSGSTTYPYYTTRGPRDFLARNPRDIGP